MSFLHKFTSGFCRMESGNKVGDSESGNANSTATDVPKSANERKFTPSNAYAAKKTVAEGALDLALLMANASKMKALVEVPANNRRRFFIGQLLLLVLSIALQIAAGLVLVILGMMDPKGEVEIKRTERLNNASVCLILLITIVNIFITTFDISYTDETTANTP